MINQSLQARLEIWCEKLALVEHALDAELQKGYRLREVPLLTFLSREKYVCANVISELRALAEEANAVSMSNDPHVANAFRQSELRREGAD
jgi:hypothetical protein